MAFHSKFHIAGTVRVGPKGQVVIPSDVREQMGINPGDKLIAISVDDHNSITFITEEQAQTLVDRLGERFAQVRQMFGKRSTR